ncbi:MAG: hypothetical protein VYC34_10625 [Planctomycetota bacterium]|nr:hypothetical protein [Planctomycetota bacterium]
MGIRLVSLIVASLLVALAAPEGARAQNAIPCEFEAPDRIIAVGTIGGELSRFQDILYQMELLDLDLNWSGGSAHLVILGNSFGPGPDLEKVHEFIRSLSAQAEKAGGMVHLLLGPTEVQTLRSDFGPLIDGEIPPYTRLITPQSEEKRERAVERLMAQQAEFNKGDRWFDLLKRDYQRALDEYFKPGAAELEAMLAPGTDLGDWLRSRNAVIRIGDYIFCHAGVSPKFAEMELSEINEIVREQVAEQKVWFPVMRDEMDPIWYSGLTSSREADTRQTAEWVLYHLGARGMVMGKAPTVNVQRSGRLFYVQSNILDLLGAPLNALELRGDAYVLHNAGETASGDKPAPLPQEEPPAPPGVGEEEAAAQAAPH